MKLSEYTIGQACEVMMLNIQTDEDEWRPAQVVNSTVIYPEHGAKHRPYTMLFVKVIRTYYKSEPVMVYDEDLGVDIYGGDEGIFYDKENIEAIIYDKQVRPKV